MSWASVSFWGELINKHGLELWLQVDGGVSASTIERCADAGADVFRRGIGGLRGIGPGRGGTCIAHPSRGGDRQGELGVRPLNQGNVNGSPSGPMMHGCCKDEGESRV
ncbi:hypothetical protein SALBM311S_12819 [Streptomyces alboniger]